jgi:hypothetical protein
MAGADQVSALRTAREAFDGAVRALEEFSLNLDPTRAQTLREWLRTLAGDGRATRASAPSLKGWPLADRIGSYVDAVLRARGALRRAGRP